jgi:hypothetical protein
MPASMDSTAMTKEDYGDWDEVLANIPQNIHDNPEAIDWGNPLDDRSPNAPSYIEPYRSEVASRPSSNDRVWQSQSVAKKRQLLLVATIGILSTVLAGLGFLGFLRSMAKPIAKEDQNKTEQKAETPALKETADPPLLEPTLPTDGTSTTEPSAITPSPDDKTDSPEPATPNITEPPKTVLSPTETPITEPPTTPNTNSPSSEKEPTTDSNLSQMEMDKKLSDLFGPTGFGELLSTSTTMAESGFGKKLTPQDLDIDDLSETKQLLYHPAPKVLPLWNEAIEAQKIERIKFQDMSLATCMDFFSRATAVGITIDWESIRATGLDEKISLSCDLQKKTLKEILIEILDRQGLGIEVEDGFPIVRPKTTETPPELATFDLSDIVPNGSEQKLAEQLVMLWELEAKCEASGGKIIWKPMATNVDVARLRSTIQLFADSTTLKPDGERNQNTKKRLLFDPSEWKEGRSLLSRKIGNSVVVPDKRSVTELMTIAFRDLDAELLIDWKSVWQHGLSPREEDNSVFRNRTLMQVSGKYLDEFALELVPIAKNSLWLTTESARRQQYIVVPVRCESDKLDDVKRALRLLTPKSIDGQSLFKFEPVAGLSDWYLARICRPRVSQIVEPELEMSFAW